MKVSRQTEKLQNSTAVGVAGICTQFLAIFGQVEISDLTNKIIGMNCQEAFTAFAPFALFLWSIWFNEDGEKAGKE